MSLKSYEVVGYAADADIWCVECARQYPNGRDGEGNEVAPVFAEAVYGCTDLVCAGCGVTVLERTGR